MIHKYLSQNIHKHLITVRVPYRRVIGALFATREYKGGTTIYALSSGQGKCGVAVVRISGSKALETLHRMTKICNLEPRKTFLRNIYDPETNEVIDKGLCLWFPGPRSFTGEDCVELHVHGGTAVLAALMNALSKLKFYPALPGEFTRRAFYNNKLDLTEIEGLADLIHAETEQQRKQAILQADGHLSKLYSGWMKILSKCAANLEAYIDFHEEDNIEDNILSECQNTLKNLSNVIENHLADGRKGEILRNGIKIVIIGAPNVGKSSLLNHLVQRNAAIVTPIAGTTRDVVELTINIGGYPVIIADTAGLTKDTNDEIECEGIRRARSHAQNADFIVLVVDAHKFKESNTKCTEYIDNYINKLELTDLLIDDKQMQKHAIVFNKVDLLSTNTKEELKQVGVIIMSCKTEEGFQDLLTLMTQKFKEICGNPSRENPTISQMRYRIHLTRCIEHLHNYFDLSSRREYDMGIAVQEIRMGMKELGSITGHVSTEEILDIIFKNFCIGK